MSFTYKKVLIVGATSGIGEALAARMVTEGIYVIIAGRRQDRLDAFVRKHGNDKVAAVAFDVTKLDEISDFATRLEISFPPSRLYVDN